MFCKKCGKKIDDDSLFCSFCGTKQSININSEKIEVLNNEKSENKTNIDNLSFKQQLTEGTKQNIIKTKRITFDPTYKKEKDASTVGIITFIATIILYFISRGNDNPQFYSITSIILLVLRIIYTIWAVNISKRQNRNVTGWGFLAFFFPAITLIILGNMEKLFDNYGINNNLSDIVNSDKIAKKANDYFIDKEYYKSIHYSLKSLELNPENKIAKDVLLKSRLKISADDIPEINEQIVCRKTSNNEILTIVSSNYKTIGAKVYINDEIAKDGVYKYADDNRILIVKNGLIDNIKTDYEYYINTNSEELMNKL